MTLAENVARGEWVGPFNHNDAIRETLAKQLREERQTATELAARLREAEADNARLKNRWHEVEDLMERPTYNHLEAGFRHTPLRPEEIIERYKQACESALLVARAALKGD